MKGRESLLEIARGCFLEDQSHEVVQVLKLVTHNSHVLTFADIEVEEKHIIKVDIDELIGDIANHFLSCLVEDIFSCSKVNTFLCLKG